MFLIFFVSTYKWIIGFIISRYEPVTCHVGHLVVVCSQP